MADPIPTPGADGSLKSSAVTTAASVALIDQLFQSLSRISDSPQQLSLALQGVNKMISEHYIKHMEKSGKLTQENRIELDRLIAQRNGILLLGTAVSQISFYMAGVTREIRQAQLEMRGFTNLASMPGGMNNYKNSVQYTRDQRSKNLSEFTVEYAKTVDEVRQRLNITMPNNMFTQGLREKYEGTGKSPSEIDALVREEAEKRKESTLSQIATLNMGTGIRVEEQIGRLADHYGKTGMDSADLTKIMTELLAKGSQGDFGRLNPSQLMETFSSQFLELTTGPANVRGDIAAAQIFNNMQLGKNNPLGANDIGSLSKLSTMFQNDLSQIQLLESRTGRKVTQGTATTGIESLESLQKYFKSLLPNVFDKDTGEIKMGVDFESAMAEFSKDTGTWAQLFKQFNMDGGDARLLLKTNFSDAKGGADDLTKILQDDLKESETATKYLKDIKDNMAGMNGLSEWLQNVKIGIQDAITTIVGDSKDAKMVMDVVGAVSGLGSAVGSGIMTGVGLVGVNKVMEKFFTKGGSSIGGLPITSSVPGGIDRIDGTVSTIPGSVGGSTRSWWGPLSKSAKWGIGIGGVVSAGEEFYQSRASGLGLGESSGRAGIQGAAVMGGMFTGAKLGARFGPWGAGIGSVLGGILAEFGGKELNSLLFGDLKDKNGDPLAANDENKNIPKIRVVISDTKNNVLADKTVKTDGQEPVTIRMLSSGTLGAG